MSPVVALLFTLLSPQFHLCTTNLYSGLVLETMKYVIAGNTFDVHTRSDGVFTYHYITVNGIEHIILITYTYNGVTYTTFKVYRDNVLFTVTTKSTGTTASIIVTIDKSEYNAHVAVNPSLPNTLYGLGELYCHIVTGLLPDPDNIEVVIV